MKAIDTYYKGYRFRSRLEARWAVFFDTLGIEYRYEPEGFELGDGIRYLPDFWLPKQDHWIEIKGQEPTQEEIDKAHMLATMTDKPVFILYGDVWHPPSYETILRTPIVSRLLEQELLADSPMDYLSEEMTKVKNIHLSCNAALLLWKISRMGYDLIINEHGIEVIINIYMEGQRSLKSLIKHLEDGLWVQNINLLKSVLVHEQEFRSLLQSEQIPEDKQILINAWSIHHQQIEFEWIVCETCKMPHLLAPGGIRWRASEEKGKCKNNARAIIAAYTAARQARFEHGERPK